MLFNRPEQIKKSPGLGEDKDQLHIFGKRALGNEDLVMTMCHHTRRTPTLNDTVSVNAELKFCRWNKCYSVVIGRFRICHPLRISCGDAHRIKLTRELSKRTTGRTIYPLNEPPTGRHFHDVKKLIAMLNAL
ncbi:MAG: hypothetical protein EF813_12510 [Methanosarcinales archaeon]|nr:MAG: hypothetical protein EF813_12510 [Methanosarcinales archaeon]